MKKFKKAAAMASSMLVLTFGMTALNSNALLCHLNGDRYQQELEKINSYEGYVSYPELCETITELEFHYNNNGVYGMSTDPGRVVNVWFDSDNTDITENFIIDYAVNDALFIYVDVFDTDVVTEEMLKQEVQEIVDGIGLSDMIAGIKIVPVQDYDEEKGVLYTTSTFNVGVYFSDENHDENYQKCKEVTSLLKERYDVTEAKARIDVHEFCRGYLEVIYSFGDLHEVEVQELNESFAENNFNVHVEKRTNPYSGKEYYGTSWEDVINMTIPERYEFATFMYRNYGKNVNAYCLASGNMTQTIDLLNLSGDADCDNRVTINDAVLIMQSIANPDKYQLTEQGIVNADVFGDGDGVTISDATAIMEMVASHMYE